MLSKEGKYMNQISKVFQFGGNQVRTILLNNEPWFVAKDVCEVFGDSHYRRSVSRLDEDEKGVTPLSTPGGTQQITIVNEAGLYSLLFNMQPQKKSTISEDEFYSRVDGLKKFKRWITHEVLPTIRKHGAYMTDDVLEKTLNDPDYIIGVITALKDEKQKRIVAEQQIQMDKPKVIFADAVSASKTSILIGELAKILKQNGYHTGQNRLYEELREKGYLIRRKGTDYNSPTQRAMELGLFEVKETAVTHSDGHVTVSKTTKVTGKGQQYFINKFLKGVSA
jgi:anti-repressor protein